MCPSSPDARDPSYGTAGAPGLSAGLVPGLGGHCVRLALVLAHVSVHKLDHVGTDGRLKNRRESGLGDILAFVAKDSN